MPAKNKKQSKLVMRLRSTPVLVACSLLVVGTTFVPTHGFGVFAATCSSSTDCQQQIDNLNAQNAQAQTALSGLQSQAGSYQDAISRLQSQISNLQQQVTDNQAQQASLQQQIVAAQQEIDHQRAVLGNDLKAMYINGQVTPMEMLATSNNISDYIDKQQAYSKVQDAIQAAVQKIEGLQKQLQSQKAAVDLLIKQLQDQQAQMAAVEAQQNQLLAYNQDQQNQFNGQIAANKSALSDLYAKQAAIIAASFGSGLHYGGTGNYPYAGAVCLNASGDCSAYSESPYNWGVNGQPYDPAGWQYRNCTSYAFWRLAQTTGVILSAGGFPATYHYNGQWGAIKNSILGGDFQNLGYRVDHDPNGSAVLAVNTAGYFGHIMYVETVVNGNAVVSQYNAAGDGRYSTGTVSPSSNIWFVHIR